MVIRRLIPNLLTAGNLIGGILAILLTLHGYIEWAPYCILISALFDFLDGFVARLLKVQSELGKQLDSLADMVTFGVAPGIIMFEMIQQSYLMNFLYQDYLPNSVSLHYPLGSQFICYMHGTYPYMNEESVCFTPEFVYVPLVALVIPVFALFRLAKFNLDTRQTSAFIGLPTPAMTLFFVSIPLMVEDGFNNIGTHWKYEITMNVLLSPYFLISSILIMSILMVVELPLFALKFKHFKFKENEIRYIFLTISIILLATLFVWALPIIILLYIILSVINNLTKKQSKDEIQS